MIWSGLDTVYICNFFSLTTKNLTGQHARSADIFYAVSKFHLTATQYCPCKQNLHGKPAVAIHAVMHYFSLQQSAWSLKHPPLKIDGWTSALVLIKILTSTIASWVSKFGNCQPRCLASNLLIKPSGSAEKLRVPIASSYMPSPYWIHEQWRPVPTISRFIGCCWIGLVTGGGDWEVRVKGDLTTRPDGKVNSSPVTASTPIIRLQHGCQHVIKIPG